MIDKYKLKKFNIYIHRNKQWIDVTNKKAIIYGVGQNCFDMLNLLELPNIYKVVDGNKKIQGTDVLIQNKLYPIEAPEILRTIDWEKYYIIISSTLYQIEILENIKNLVARDIVVGVWNTDIRYCYDNIEDMIFLDPILKNKIVRLSLSFDVYHIINNFYKICESCFQKTKIDKFIPIQKGVGKLVFLFGNEKNLWVYSIKGKMSSLNKLIMQKNEDNLFKKKFYFIENHNLDKEITIYRDKDGILVQKYALNQINFKNLEIRKQVMLECRRIHEMNPIGLEENHRIEDTYEFYRLKISNNVNIEEKNQAILQTIYELMEENINILKLSNIKKVIHGDLLIDNIVMFQNKVIFIDWEFLSLGNPMIDVVQFLFYIHYTEYLKNEISFFEMCRKCFFELSFLLRDYCRTEEEVLNYQEIAKVILKIYILRYVLQMYLVNHQNGIQKMTEFIDFYDNL